MNIIVFLFGMLLVAEIQFYSHFFLATFKSFCGWALDAILVLTI